MTDPVAAMQSLSDEIHLRLLDNPDYRAKVALDRAIAEANGTMNAHWSSLKQQADSLCIGGSGRTFGMANRIHFYGGGEALPSGKMSQADAAWAVLKSTMRPMTTAELIEPVRGMGATLGGDDPATNLSSSLSREKDRFQSLRWNRRTCWWFKDAAVPREEKSDDETDKIFMQLLGRARFILQRSRTPVPMDDLYRLVQGASSNIHFSAAGLKEILSHSGVFTETPDGWALLKLPSDNDVDQGDDQAVLDGDRKGRWS